MKEECFSFPLMLPFYTRLGGRCFPLNENLTPKKIKIGKKKEKENKPQRL